MKLTEKLAQKARDNAGRPGVTVAFLGDSVTQGCFELYELSPGCIETVFDQNSAYSTYLARIFRILYPSVPFNVINAGISGGSAPHGLMRLDRDVISHKPDLTVVCFGLNDCGRGEDGLKDYIEALGGIFAKLTEAGSEIVFMTPNMMCTHLSPRLERDIERQIAGGIGGIQNGGMLDRYLDAAKALCAEKGVTVCDCYAKWKRLYECGVDTTELLANKINHPDRSMNWLFAFMLADTLLS